MDWNIKWFIALENLYDEVDWRSIELKKIFATMHWRNVNQDLTKECQD
jgi:hypothetical protein